MARSRRRTSRRTTSQRAASLIALALPAPVQRIADTRIGSLLMLVGVPLMILFGLLNITWVDGFPTFSLNRNKASELRNVAAQRINELENQAALQNWGQNWGQSTVDLLHAAQGPNHTHQAPAFPSTQPQASVPIYDWQQHQQHQQQLYQRQVYEQQLQQQQYQQQQPYQQLPANSGQQAYQGSYPSTYGYSGQFPYTNQGGQVGRY